MKKINKYGMLSGIVKVIPPDEWKALQPRLDEQVKTIKVKEPIKQDIMGTSGTYRQANMVHQRSYNLPQWRQLCDQSEHQPPAKRGERRANQDKPPRPAPKNKPLASVESSASSTGKRRRGRPFKSAAKAKRGMTVDTEDGEPGTPDRLLTPVSPSTHVDEASVKTEVEEEDDTPVKGRMGSRQAKPQNPVSVSSRRKNNRREREGKIDEAAFKDFKYELEGDEYTPERCEELERAYWKTLTYAPPLYGADMPGTLFDERTKSWNLGRLDNILDVMGSNIPGVNSAYLYLGMWKATFAWHLEDVDLYSINYLHFGAPKQWYSIAQPDARRFEAAMRTVWPTDAKACDQFLRHKTFLISPSHLLSNFNIKVNKVVSNPGEFVITFPYGYHSGYNLGYNCAEAVNFGLEEWLQYGRVAKKCDCDQAQDSVWINVHDLERKMRGEETEEEFDEEDEDEDDEDDENDTSQHATIPEHGGVKINAPKKKRKRATNDKTGSSNMKRIRVRIRVPAKEPCILCPNDIPSEPLLPTGNKGEKVHRICAQYIPETSIEEGKVVDVEYIHKDRMALKCNYCRSKKGACFQCSRKKCTRAYHATCAAAAGVFVEQGETAVFGEDQTEYKDWGIEFGCRFHRAKRDKKLDSDALSESDRLRKAGAALKAGEVCQVQYHKSDIWAGAIVENCTDEEMLVLDVLPRGDRVEVPYTWLLLPESSDYHLTKPSANAIPMPKSRKDKASLNTSKRQADDLPRAEDPFVEGHTWAEFNRGDIPVNQHQVKIDFTKADQTWFYLGKTSTEARAQYTENPASKRHNPRGNFLDTIPKAVVAAPRQSYAASYPTHARNSTQTPVRPPTRPAMPARTSSSGSSKDRPYEYKPRQEQDNYRVDPQAYRSQQSFLQRSAPLQYTFGTDPNPRWKAPDTSTPTNTNGYTSSTNNQTPSQSYNTTPQSQFRTPQTSATAPTQYTQPRETAQSHQSGQVQRSVPAYLAGQPPYSAQTQHSSPVPQAHYTPQAQQTGMQSPHNAQSPRPSSGYQPSPLQHNVQAPRPAATPQTSQPQHVQTQRTPQVQQFAPPSQKVQAQHTPQPEHAQPQYPAQTQHKSSSQSVPPTQYRQPQATSAPPKPNNPFGSRPQTSRPTNVFAKYPYLQKEHNRSPLEYKSPYRPGGGFMNGYQGNIEKHLQQTMFAKRSSTGTSIPSPASTYSSVSSMQPPSNTQVSASSPSYNPGYSASYNAHAPSPVSSYTASPSIGPEVANTGNVSSPTWAKKESAQVHPAIRQEFHNSIFQHQYNPPPGDVPAQPRSAVLQPPPLYERPPYQPLPYNSPNYTGSQTIYNALAHPQQQAYHSHTAPQSLSASHPQQYNKPADQSDQSNQHTQQTYSASQSPNVATPVHQASVHVQTPSTANKSYNARSSAGYSQQSGISTMRASAAAPVAPVSGARDIFGQAIAPSQGYDSPRAASQSASHQSGTSKSSSPQVAPAQATSKPMALEERAAANSAQSPILPPNYKPTTILPPPKTYSVSKLVENQSNTVHLHQANSQKTATVYQPQAPQPEYFGAQPKFEPADVPPNSSALIEQMMMNLRKARPAY